MKTNTFVAIASLVLVVTYFLVMRIEPEQKISMTQFVPETALFYTEQHNGLEALKKFNTSSLGQKLKESIPRCGIGGQCRGDKFEPPAIIWIPDPLELRCNNGL